MGQKSKDAAGSCLCGQVRFRIEMPTRFCAHCHCSNCRRAHGAAFVTWVGVKSEQLILEGDDRLQRYETDTGATRSFCNRCGTTLFYESPRWAGEVHIVRSNIDGQIDRQPGAHVYVDHAADWWQIDDGLPQYGGTTGTDQK